MAEFKEQAAPAGNPAVKFDRIRSTAQQQLGTAERADAQIMLGVIAVVGTRIINRGIEHIVLEYFGNGMADEALAARFEQVFCRWICVMHVFVLINQNNRGPEKVKSCERRDGHCSN